MHSSNENLGLYFSNVVNSQLQFQNHRLHYTGWQNETVKKNMWTGNLPCTENQSVVHSHYNSCRFVGGIQSRAIIPCSGTKHSNQGGYNFYRPIAQDFSRRWEHVNYQSLTETQPLDYSNNYRRCCILNRVNENNSIPTTVNFNTKMDNLKFAFCKKQLANCSLTKYTCSQKRVDSLQGIVDIVPLGTANGARNIIRRVEKNIIQCSGVNNDLIETFSSEEKRVSNLKSIETSSKQVHNKESGKDSYSKIECSLSETENNRICREIVNEIVESIEYDSSIVGKEIMKTIEKEANFVSDDEEMDNRIPKSNLSLSDSSLKPAKGMSFPCSECLWEFSSKVSLAKHVAKKHEKYSVKLGQESLKKKNDVPQHSDKMCCFSDKIKLKVHTLVHFKDKRLKCDICSLTFKKRRDLDCHSLKHNKKALPVCCEICGKTFSQAGNLRMHLRIHTKEKPYSCPHCEKSYAQSGDMKMHIRMHTHDRPYLCEYCGQLYYSWSHLKRHIKMHTKERPYMCEVCGHSFAHSHHLTKHYRVHTKEKPYSCDICGKHFSRADYVKQHVRVHTKEKPYICRICGKGFSQGGSLKLHQRVHNKV